MTKLLLLFVLAAGCGGKKSAPARTPGSGSATSADLKPTDGNDAKPDTKDTSDEDPCAVPSPQ